MNPDKQEITEPLQPTQKPSPIKWLILGVVAIVGVGAGVFAMSSDKKSANNLEAEFAQTSKKRSFEAFKDRARKKIKPVAKKKKIRPNDDNMTAEERAAWKLAESTGQDVVYENVGEDPSPKPAVVATKKASTSLLPAGRRSPMTDVDNRRRFKTFGANNKQRNLLRNLNAQLTKNPQILQKAKVDTAVNLRLKRGLPYKLKPIKQLPINPNPPQWTPPKVKGKAFLPEAYGGGPMPDEGSITGDGK